MFQAILQAVEAVLPAVESLAKHRARLRLYFNGGYRKVTLTIKICGTSSIMITTHIAMSTP